MSSGSDSDGRKVVSADDAARCNLFIGNLPLTFDNESLKAMFAPFGKIVRCKVGYDKLTGVPMGYGFVQYDNEESARKAIVQLNDYKLGERRLKVAIAEKKHEHELKHLANVYVTNLPISFTQDDLDNLCAPFGNSISCSRLMVDERGNSKGYGFVRFEGREQAQKCIDALNNTVPRGATQPLIVKFARDPSEKAKELARLRALAALPPSAHYGMSPPKPGPTSIAPSMGRNNTAAAAAAYNDPYMTAYMMTGTGGQQQQQEQDESNSNLYIANVPLHYNKAELDSLFAPYGTISKSRILTNPNGTSRGLGFVKFDNVASAQRAINAMDGTIAPSGQHPLNVKFANTKTNQPSRDNNHYSKQAKSGYGGSSRFPVQTNRHYSPY